MCEELMATVCMYIRKEGLFNTVVVTHGGDRHTVFGVSLPYPFVLQNRPPQLKKIK